MDWKITDKHDDKTIQQMGNRVEYVVAYEETPEVYRCLDDVLAFHSDSVRVVERLTPLIVCMAGANEYDPYKD